MPARPKKLKPQRKPDGGSVRLATDPDRLLTKDQLRAELLQVGAFQAYMVAVAAKKGGTPGAKKRNTMTGVAEKEGKKPAEAKPNVAPTTLGRQAYKAEIAVRRVRLPSLAPPFFSTSSHNLPCHSCRRLCFPPASIFLQ